MSDTDFTLNRPDDESPSLTVDAANSADADADVSVDAIFDALAHERRQLAIRHLLTAEQLTLSDLAEHVAAREYNTTVGSVGTETHSRVYTGLYHAHVPKLADMGFVEYDADTDIVTLTEQAEQLTAYMNLTDSL